MLLAALVVEQRAPLSRLADRRRRDGAAGGQLGRQLEHVQRGPRVAVGQAGDVRERVVGDAHAGGAEAALAIGQRAAKDLDDLGLAQRPQDIHAAARQQRAVHLERGVLGGGADQHDGGLLDVRQECVLLPAVEAVDLVDEEDRAAPPPRALGLGLGDDLADLLHAGQHGRERHEARAHDVRHQRGQRGLAGARRPPEDHRVQLATLECCAQHAAGAEQVLLTDDLVERARPHAIRQGAGRRGPGRAGGLLEQLHATDRPTRATTSAAP